MGSLPLFLSLSLSLSLSHFLILGFFKDISEFVFFLFHFLFVWLQTVFVGFFLMHIMHFMVYTDSCRLGTFFVIIIIIILSEKKSKMFFFLRKIFISLVLLGKSEGRDEKKKNVVLICILFSLAFSLLSFSYVFPLDVITKHSLVIKSDIIINQKFLLFD